MEYYIVENNERHGPYDLVSMIRKIRNGSVTRQTLVEQEGIGQVPATDIDKLREIFAEEAAAGAAPEIRHTQHYSLTKGIKNGTAFLHSHLTASIEAGVVLMLTLLAVLALGSVLHKAVAFVIAYVLFIFLLFIFSYFILRMVRGQSADMRSTLPIIMNRIKPLAIAAVVIAIPSAVGLLLIIPGLMVLALYIFTPFLILDRNLDVWEAMEVSRKTAFARGTEFFGVVFALIVIDFIGAVMLLVPLAITLPVTFYALAELYDEDF